MYEDREYDIGTAYTIENFDDPDMSGYECQEPGNFEECPFSSKDRKRYCMVYEECRAGTLY